MQILFSALQFILIFAFLLVNANVLCFVCNFNQPPIVAKSSSLTTARSGFSCQIPRLEPGLRIKTSEEGPVEAPVFACNALDWLAKIPCSEESEKVQKRSVFENQHLLFNIAAKAIQAKFMSRVRKVVASSLIVASNILSNPVGPNMRRVAMAGMAVATALSSPKAAFAGLYKNYNKLSPYEKLGTTPLFFVCNSGGNPYLQEDLQARSLHILFHRPFFAHFAE